MMMMKNLIFISPTSILTRFRLGVLLKYKAKTYLLTLFVPAHFVFDLGTYPANLEAEENSRKVMRAIATKLGKNLK